MGKKNKDKKENSPISTGPTASTSAEPTKMKNKEYEAELFKLQVELVKLQEWVKKTKARIVIIFEGRDAAG